MILGSTTKYEEIALTLIIKKKEDEFKNDKRKTFEDGLLFNFLATNIQDFYRLRRLVENRKEKLNSTQQQLFEKCVEIENRFLFDFINKSYLAKNCFNIIDKLKQKRI